MMTIHHANNEEKTKWKGIPCKRKGSPHTRKSFPREWKAYPLSFFRIEIMFHSYQWMFCLAAKGCLGRKVRTIPSNWEMPEIVEEC